MHSRASLPRGRSASRLQEIHQRWERAVEYYRSRGAVLFLSYERFWEAHGFVQQSLARCLAEAGIPVLWLDGPTLRPGRPVVPPGPSRPEVRPLRRIPGSRFRLVRELNGWRFARPALAWLRRHPRSVVWVQAGFDPETLARLPHIDVFSTFDDPRRHPPGSDLCRRARLIVCQNRYAESLQKPFHPDKTRQLLPPVELRPETFLDLPPPELPAGFPEKRMGYLGSFYTGGFDFALMERLADALPDWGFLLQGRTDDAGERTVAGMARRRKNFLRLPWCPRERLGATWKALDVSLLLYLSPPNQAGAFPTKILESLFFGVPAVATRVPWTADLEGFIPRTSDPAALATAALEAARTPDQNLASLYDHFAFEMDPRLHLARVAEWLRD